jgi:hypothetical protein
MSADVLPPSDGYRAAIASGAYRRYSEPAWAPAAAVNEKFGF